MIEGNRIIMMDYIKKRILDLSAQKKLSINGLARASKLPATTVKNILSGDSQNPGIITLQKICNGLNVSLIEFFDTEEFRKINQKLL